MQRLSLGSPSGRPSRVSAAGEEEAGPADEKAAKARAPAAPDRSIHLVPVLTLLCFLVLFLLSHDPSAAAAARTDSPVDVGHVARADSPVLAAAATVTARSLDTAAAAAGAAEATTTASSGVYRRLKQSRVRRLGMARRRL